MLYLSGVVRPDMPAMITPRMRQKPAPGQVWAADNGRFSAPENYTDARYLSWLAKMPVESCLFAAAPDVVGDAAATLEMSRPMLRQIRALGYPAALVAQDGLEAPDVSWDEFDCLFVGGTTLWKLSEAAYSLVAEAKRRGKWTHMGRVNSWQRFRAAAAAGYDSADGTVLRFDPGRPVHEWSDRAQANPGLWSDERTGSVFQIIHKRVCLTREDADRALAEFPRQEIRTEVERFWQYVQKGPGCWLWTGTRTTRGYGMFSLDGHRKRPAHRYSLELALGEKLPTHIYACHHCDNPPCVRPDHLYAGTQADNMADAKARGRLNTELAVAVRQERRRGRMREHYADWQAENRGVTESSQVLPAIDDRTRR